MGPPQQQRLPAWVAVTLVIGLALVALGGAQVMVVQSFQDGSVAGAASTGLALPAEIGQPLVMHGMTVTLDSAQTQTKTTFIGTIQTRLILSLRCANHTARPHGLRLTRWKLYSDTDMTTRAPYTSALWVFAGCYVRPHEVQDVNLSIAVELGDHSPYMLVSDAVTAQRQPLAWTFRA
jgi:hypothetical protein